MHKKQVMEQVIAKAYNEMIGEDQWLHTSNCLETSLCEHS